MLSIFIQQSVEFAVCVGSPGPRGTESGDDEASPPAKRQRLASCLYNN